MDRFTLSVEVIDWRDVPFDADAEREVLVEYIRIAMQKAAAECAERRGVVVSVRRDA
mgnify:CR=1 FL=1